VNKISMTEIMFLTVAVTVATAVMFTPYLMAQAAGQDAWLSVIVSGVITTIPAMAAATLMSKFPGQSIVQALPCLLGKLLGKLVSLAYIGYFLFAAALALWRLEAFTARFILVDTPQLAVRILFILVVTYASMSGATPLIRVGAYVVPVGIIVILLVVGLPIAQMEPAFLLPIFETGYQPMLQGGIMLLGWLCQVPVIILMFQRYAKTKNSRQASKLAVLGVILSAFALELGAVGTLAVFGPRQSASMYYPAFEVARIVSVGQFIEHIEVLFVAVWVAGIFLATAAYVQAFGDSISDVFNFKGRAAKTWIMAGTALLLILWPLFFRDLSFLLLIASIRDYASPPTVVLGGIVPLLLLARVKIWPVRQKEIGDGGEAALAMESEEESSQQKQ